MAAPMRSTDFRSIVEPILNECFDGVYDQRTDEWSRVFREERKASPVTTTKSLFCTALARLLNCLTALQCRISRVACCSCKRYVYNVYGLAFALTKVLVEDGDHIRIGQVYAKSLGSVAD
jgi:hypothetical protein